MLKFKEILDAEMKQKNKEYQKSLMIGHYPLGYWASGYIFGAFKQPENSHALGNLVWIIFTLRNTRSSLSITQQKYKMGNNNWYI